jgi:HSP20 family protein
MMDMGTDLQRLQREMNRLFSGFSQSSSHDFPAVNVWVDEHDAVVTAELPGIDPGKIDVSVVGDVLTLSGSCDKEILQEGENYHRQERHTGYFTRTMQMPFRIDAGRIEARYEKGILRITLPRSEEDKPKKIAIKSE